jgi:hypothetical protein
MGLLLLLPSNIECSGQKQNSCNRHYLLLYFYVKHLEVSQSCALLLAAVCISSLPEAGLAWPG